MVVPSDHSVAVWPSLRTSSHTAASLCTRVATAKAMTPQWIRMTTEATSPWTPVATAATIVRRHGLFLGMALIPVFLAPRSGVPVDPRGDRRIRHAAGQV